jgi:hypothetical protein
LVSMVVTRFEARTPNKVSTMPAENGTFLSFPYVCPEPVLVKQCILYINGSKMAVFPT